jgi:glycerol uptake facilitator-like aquaporin
MMSIDPVFGELVGAFLLIAFGSGKLAALALNKALGKALNSGAGFNPEGLTT